MALTITLVIFLVLGIMNSGFTFMIFTSIALLANYRSKQEQNKKIKGFSPNVLNMVLNVMSVGVLIGVMQEGGFVDALAEMVVSMIPAAMGPYVFVIIALFSTPLLMALGTGAYYQGLLPVIVGMCGQFGVDPLLAAAVILVPSGVSVSMSPLVAANHISCGMMGYEMGDVIKYGWKWVTAISWIAVLATCITVKFFV
ncbi:MAG: hypothetical protein HFG70_13090 [Hungatella sp.]|nr:hypothetical protein [Hungatella sp.]